MQLGVNLGFLLGAGEQLAHAEVVAEAEMLGYDVCWVAEAYGSDAPTLLAWLAAKTTTIGLGAAVLQIPARTPTMTAMTAASLDVLSGGRFRLGLGVSGPQVSEGWHGEPFDKPLERTREYVEIVRSALRREVVSHVGRRYRLPLPGGAGKALKLSLRGHRPNLPIYLAAIGPKNMALAGELADGWLGIFCAPDQLEVRIAQIAQIEATATRGTGQTFDVAVSVPVVVGDSVRDCADRVRGYAALYVGGMGSREQNFYNAQAARLGFGAAARAVQDAYLDGRVRDAMAAVPHEFIDAVSLLGPPDRVADGLRAYADAGVTTLSATLFDEHPAARVATLRALVTAAESAGL